MSDSSKNKPNTELASKGNIMKKKNNLIKEQTELVDKYNNFIKESDNTKETIDTIKVIKREIKKIDNELKNHYNKWSKYYEEPPTVYSNIKKGKFAVDNSGKTLNDYSFLVGYPLPNKMIEEEDTKDEVKNTIDDIIGQIEENEKDEKEDPPNLRGGTIEEEKVEFEVKEDMDTDVKMKVEKLEEDEIKKKIYETEIKENTVGDLKENDGVFITDEKPTLTNEEQKEEQKEEEKEQPPPYEEPKTNIPTDIPMGVPIKNYDDSTKEIDIELPPIKSKSVNNIVDNVGKMSEDLQIIKEDESRDKKQINRLKDEIKAYHLVYNDNIPEFNTKKHKEDKEKSLKSDDINMVRKHHHNMEKIIREHFRSSKDLKVGVILSASSLGLNFNNFSSIPTFNLPNHLQSAMPSTPINILNQNQPIITDKSKNEDRFSKALRTNVGYGAGGMLNFRKDKMVNLSGDDKEIIRAGRIKTVLTNQQNINYHKVLGAKSNEIKKPIIRFK